MTELNNDVLTVIDNGRIVFENNRIFEINQNNQEKREIKSENGIILNDIYYHFQNNWIKTEILYYNKEESTTERTNYINLPFNGKFIGTLGNNNMKITSNKNFLQATFVSEKSNNNIGVANFLYQVVNYNNCNPCYFYYNICIIFKLIPKATFIHPTDDLTYTFPLTESTNFTVPSLYTLDSYATYNITLPKNKAFGIISIETKNKHGNVFSEYTLKTKVSNVYNNDYFYATISVNQIDENNDEYQLKLTSSLTSSSQDVQRYVFTNGQADPATLSPIEYEKYLILISRNELIWCAVYDKNSIINDDQVSIIDLYSFYARMDWLYSTHITATNNGYIQLAASQFYDLNQSLNIKNPIDYTDIYWVSYIGIEQQTLYGVYDEVAQKYSIINYFDDVTLNSVNYSCSLKGQYTWNRDFLLITSATQDNILKVVPGLVNCYASFFPPLNGSNNTIVKNNLKTLGSSEWTKASIVNGKINIDPVWKAGGIISGQKQYPINNSLLSLSKDAAAASGEIVYGDVVSNWANDGDPNDLFFYSVYDNKFTLLVSIRLDTELPKDSVAPRVGIYFQNEQGTKITDEYKLETKYKLVTKDGKESLVGEHYIDSVDNLNYIFTDVFLLSGSYLYPRITFSTGYAKNVTKFTLSAYLKYKPN